MFNLSLKHILPIAFFTIFGNMQVLASNQASTPATTAVKECVGEEREFCILRNFKDSIEASRIRGKIAYDNYCVLCHGKSGLGDGRAAKLHNPKPANLTASTYPAEYISRIIVVGGEAMSRSPAMPPWGNQLTDEQIKDIVNLLMSIRAVAK